MIFALEAKNSNPFMGSTVYGGMKILNTFRAALFLALLSSLSAVAQTTNTFTGSGGPNWWNVATNWSLGTVPTSTNDVLINSNTTVNIASASSAGTVTLSGDNARFNILTDVPLNATGINMTGTSGNNVSIFMDAGTLTLNGGTGSINTSGGVTSFLNINGNATVNLATANLTYLWMKGGGSASVPAQLTITNGQTYNTAVTFLGSAAGQSTLNLSGGTLNAGTMIVTGSAVNITNIFNLNAGTLTAGTIRRDFDGLVMNFNFNDGTIANAAGADLNISRNTTATQNMVISLAGTGTHTFQADSGRTITVSSTASLADKAGEAGTLVKAGAGNMILAGTNTYTGLTTINAGTLSLNSGAAIADTGAVSLANTAGATLAVNSSETIGSLRGGGTTGGNVNLASGQTLTVAETGNQAFAGAITNAGSLTKSGAGTTRLSGANTYSGATTIAAGTLQIGDGGTTGAIGSTSGISISNGATLAFNRTDNYGGNFTRTLSGAGGVTVSGGTLTLQNTGNTFTGGVAVNGGTFMSLGNSAGSNIVVNSGGTFAMAGTDTWGSAGITSSPAVTINSGGTMTSDNQFNSLRDLTLNGGSVNLNGGLNSTTGAFVLGGTVTAGGLLTSSITATTGANNFIRLGRQGASEQTTFNVSNAAGQLTVDVTLKDNFGVTAGVNKTGAGKLVLSGSNDYTGATTVGGGTLQIGNGGTTGAISVNSALSVSNGATLAFNRMDNYGGAFNNAITGAGTVAVNAGNLILNAAGSSGYSTNLGIVINNGGTVTLGHSDMFGGTGWDATTSPGFTVNAGGTLASSNNFNTLWNVNLNGGTLLANGGANSPAQAFALAGTVTVGGSSASLIQAGTNGNGLNMVNISGNGNSTLTFNVADVTSSSAADLTVTAGLQNSRGVLSSLNKTGSGTLVLAASNSYTGSTTVSGGTLQIGNGGTTGNLGTATDGIAISNGATLAFNRSDNYGGNFTRTLSGGGGVTVSGGTLTLQNTSNSFTGGVTVNGGTFKTLGNSAGSNIVVNSGGTFAMAGSDTWGNAAITSSPAVTINSGGTMTSDNQFNSLRNLTLNGGAVNLNGGLNSTTGAFVLGGTVTVGGALTSSITASTGANNFIRLGRETVVGGVTEFNVTDAAGLLTVGAELANNFGASTAGLRKSGSGTLSLAAANSYTGTTAVNAGLLKVLSGGSISSSSTTVNNGGTLDVGGTAGNVQVNTGGLLKGSGSVGAFTLASGGTLAPGNSPGTLTAASAIVLGGSTYNWQISALNGTAGTNWDLFSVTNLLDMSGVTSGNKWNLVVTGDSGFAGWTDTSSYSYVFAQAASVSGFSSVDGTDVTSLFNITTSGIASVPNASYNANGDFKVVVGSANGLTTLNLMAVPEPSTGSMLGLGLAGVVATRLLRRKSS